MDYWRKREAEKRYAECVQVFIQHSKLRSKDFLHPRCGHNEGRPVDSGERNYILNEVFVYEHIGSRVKQSFIRVVVM